MTQRQMSIRIGLDGKADIQRDMADIAQSGDASFGQLGKAIDQATAAIERQKAAQDNLVTAQANIAQQRAGQSWFNNVLGVNPGSGAGSAQASATAFAQMETRAAALRAQIDPLGAATAKLNSATLNANELAAAGAITEVERAAAVARAAKEFEAAKVSLQGFAAMEGVGSTQSMALFAAIRHMIDATVAGRPPLQSLAMEAGNLSYGLSGSGGVLNAVKAVGGGIASFLLSPLGLAAAAFVAIGGAAYAGISRASEAEKQFTDATQFAGKAAGLTREQFDAIAQSAAKSGDISVNAARDIESAFARSGAIQQQTLSGLIAITQKYARATGQSMDEARDALVKAFADPAKGGEQLLAGLGALDDKTKQYLDTLVEQNRLTDAQVVLEGKLTEALKGSTDQTGFFARAWQDVKNAVSGAAEALSHGFTAPALGAQLVALQSELANAKQGLGTGVTAPRSIAEISADIAKVTAQIDALNQKAKQGAADAAATTLSNAAGSAVRAAIPGFGDLKTLQDRKAVVDQLLASKAALDKTAVSLGQAKDAEDAYTRAIQTYIDPATKAQKLGDLEIASINARTPAQKAALAGQREAIELSGKLITTATANAQIQQAEKRAYAEATITLDKHTQSLRANIAAEFALAEAYLKGTAAGQLAEEGQLKYEEQLGRVAVSGAKQVAQIRDETAARRAINDQVAAGVITSEQATREMSIQSALAPLITAQSIAEGAAKAELTKIIAALTAARTKDNAEADRSKALAEVEAGNRNVALLQQELSIANDNDAARQVELAVLQKKQELLSQNIDVESKEGRAILASTAYATQLTQQLDLAKASRQEVENSIGGIADKWGAFIASGKYDFKDLRSVALSTLQDITSEMVKLSLINPLKNALFGENLPDINSVSSAFSKIFGGNSGNPASGAAGLLKPDGSAINPFYVVMSPLGGAPGGSSGGGLSSIFSSLFGNGGGSGAVPGSADAAGSAGASSGDFFSSIGDFFASIFHTGGTAGFGNDNRAMPAHVFRFAPRLHKGGYLAPDEVPAILQKGERVLNRKETRDYNGTRGAAAPSFKIVNVFDPKIVGDYLATAEGEQVVMNVLQRNRII